MTTKTKAPGFFETARNLFSAASGSAVEGLRVVEDAAKTTRGAMIPMRVDNIIEAKESLTAAGMDFESFMAAERQMLNG